MIEIKGKYNEIKAYTDIVEESCLTQLYNICRQKIFEGTKIRIMPDTHTGKGSVIGFTCIGLEYVIPNIIGSDIGCGMEVTELGDINIDFEKLDKFIMNNIPASTNINKKIDERIGKHWREDLKSLSEKLNHDLEKNLRALGSLGGGNHFIEINRGNNGEKYLVIHSGSRRLGNDTALYHQKKAEKYCDDMRKESDRDSIYFVSKELSFLEDDNAQEYLEDMKLVQKYAELNRKIIAARIVEFLGLDYGSSEKFTVVHNYYNFEDKIIRKGAISAHKNEKIIIPVNMRDGSILAIGKGNEEWNLSAPHGAGRLMSRGRAKENISLERFRKSMKGVYTTSVKASTVDEAPMAYKPIEEIMKYLDNTVEVIEIIKPIYNFKA